MRLNYQFQLIQAIRNFFTQKGFLDVLTPPMVENPGMETHIHPFQVESIYNKSKDNMYLHTSPEFHMKELLSMDEEELNNIFTISYCFRDEPQSEIHRSQFLMLEWYRKNSHYSKIMDDVEELIKYCLNYFADKGFKITSKLNKFEATRVTVQDLFFEYCNFDVLEFLDAKELELKLRKDFKNVPVPDCSLIYEDSFFLLFLNLIEPHFTNYSYLQVSEYPAPLAALSTLKTSDPRVCERFEVYLSGVELCNCFNELTDIDEQKKRFLFQNKQKLELYNYQLTTPHVLFNALERGLPKSSGVALGIERLLFSLFDIKNPFYQ